MNRYCLTGLLVWVAYVPFLTVTLTQGVVGGTGLPNRSVVRADTSRLLFARDSVLPLTLRANLRVLLKDRGDTPATHPATLT